VKTIFGLFFLALAHTTFSASLTGLLDPLFNVDLGPGFVWKMAAQPDEKIVILGDFETVNGVARSSMARLTPDGAVDPSFTANQVIDPIWHVRTLTIAPGNKVLLSGTITNYGDRKVQHIMRLNSDGSFDTTFHPAEPPMDYIFAVAVQNDGKLVVGGSDLVRLLDDGSIDRTFTARDWGSFVYSLGIYSDGKILVGGPDGVRRLNANGSPDVTFQNATRPSGMVMAVLALPDGRAIVGGQTNFVFSRSSTSLMRLKADGSVDPTFISPVRGQVAFLRLDQKQRILLAASSGQNSVGFVRLKPDGSFDPTFDFQTARENAPVDDVIFQQDGRMVIQKSMWMLDGITHTNSLARLYETNATSVIYSATKDPDQFESVTNLTVTLRRVGNTETPLTVNYRTEDETARAGVNYVAAQGTVNFTPGQRTNEISLLLIDDAARTTSGGTFKLDLAVASGNGIPHPDETPIHILIRDADWLTSIEFVKAASEFNESLREVYVYVKRPAAFAFNGNVQVDYHTEDGTARAGIDYQATFGTLTFWGYNGGHGVQSMAGLAVPIFPNDTTTAPRTFRVILSNPRVTRDDNYYTYFKPVRVHAQIGSPATHEVTLIDDRLGIDSSGVVRLLAPPWVGSVIEASTNLIDWLPIHTNVPNADVLFSDPQTAPHKFYRAIELR
jgi:uncharacterized delta-60 repeat protein